MIGPRQRMSCQNVRDRQTEKRSSNFLPFDFLGAPKDAHVFQDLAPGLNQGSSFR